MVARGGEEGRMEESVSVESVFNGDRVSVGKIRKKKTVLEDIVFLLIENCRRKIVERSHGKCSRV